MKTNRANYNYNYVSSDPAEPRDGAGGRGLGHSAELPGQTRPLQVQERSVRGAGAAKLRDWPEATVPVKMIVLNI